VIALHLALAAFALPLSVAGQDKKPPVKVAQRAKYVMPLAVVPGFAGKVTVRGFGLDTATEVMADAGVAAKVLGKPRKATPPQNVPPELTGDTEIDVELALPKDFAAPHVALKVGTADAVKLLVVPRLVAELEPNDGFATGQLLVPPVTLHGTIDKPRDVDVYRFVGRKGQRWRFAVTARKLGSPVDALLTLYDDRKRVVESCDDNASDADPSFTATLPRDGVYFLSVIDSHDQGGGIFPYVLSVSAAK
jgi:hypothetical protein